MSELRAVLLDIDGTLVDSNDAHATAWVEALAEFGYDVPFVRGRPLIGMGGDKLLPEVTGVSKDSPEGKRITERRQKLFMERHLPMLKPFPEADRLAERMHASGLRLVVATSANAEEMQALAQVARLEPFLYHTTSASEAKSSKPDPDIVEVALRKAGAAPEETLLLGDTQYDIAAGKEAGIAVVALRSGGTEPRQLEGAIAVYDDPAALLRAYADSPFSR